MSKRRPTRQQQQVVEVAVAVAEVLDSKTHAGRKGLGTAEAKRIQLDAEAKRRARRQGRIVWRLRRQLAPWWVALGLLGAALILWGARLAGASAGAAGSVAGLAGAGGVAVTWFVVRGRAGVWCRRLYVGAAAGAGWLVVAAWSGPSAWLLLALVLLTVTVSARWWQHHRIPNPKGRPLPAEIEPERHDGPIHVRWDRYIAGKRGVLPDSRLSGRDTSHANREMYDGHLDPGQQTLSTVRANLDKISSGLNVPIRDLLAEEHPSGLPTLFRLTVVTKSPIAETVVYQGPRVAGGVIHLGPYGDGEGYAPWRLWTPGEKPNAGSAWGGYVVGGVGIGKSRLMELLAIGAMSTGWVTVMFCDPQNGASSPDLADAANWYVGIDGVERLLTALERIAEYRGKEMAAEGWSGFDPRPDRPLILVFIDESHEVFAIETTRWEILARKIRKLGMEFVALSQYPGLVSFGGSEPLRAAIMAGNTVVMRSESKQNGQLVAGLEMDPLTLPNIPGFAYLVKRGNDARTAPFRSEYVTAPGEWMRRFPSVDLDPLVANAAGPVYLNRHADMRAAQEANRREIEAMRAGRTGGAAGGTSTTANARTAPGAGAAFTVPTFPTAPNLHIVRPASGDPVAPGLVGEGSAQPAATAAVSRPVERSEPPTAVGPSGTPDPSEGRAAPKTARELILDQLAKGEARPQGLRALTGVGETRVRQILDELIEAGAVEKVGHGRYRLRDKAA